MQKPGFNLRTLFVVLALMTITIGATKKPPRQRRSAQPAIVPIICQPKATVRDAAQYFPVIGTAIATFNFTCTQGNTGGCSYLLTGFLFRYDDLTGHLFLVKTVCRVETLSCSQSIGDVVSINGIATRIPGEYVFRAVVYAGVDCSTAGPKLAESEVDFRIP